MELQGRVVRLLPLKSGVSQSTGNPYTTQEFIFGFYESADSIYEKNIVLNVRNDNIEKYNLSENDKIKVRISLGCREFPQGSGKYYNDIKTGDIAIIEKAKTEPAQQQPAVEASGTVEQAAPAEKEDDGLPF